MRAERSLIDTENCLDAGPPRVSIAMCTYNGAVYLGEQLESIAEQTLQPCELVVCDDGSTDATVEMLESFARRAGFPVRVFRNEMKLGTTWNFEKAMRLCAGEFVALCDQDDVWVKGKLERLVELLQADAEALGVFSDAAILDAESAVMVGSLWQRFRFGAHRQKAFRRDAVRVLLQHDIVTGATLMARRSVMEMFDTIPVCWLQDGWLAWMVVLHGRMLLTPEKLTRYRVHSAQQVGTGSMSVAARVRMIRSGERVRYRRLAQQCEALLAHLVERSPEDVGVRKLLVAKACFLNERAEMGAGLMARLWFLATNVRRYKRYARGWRSMRKDLVL